MWIGGRFGSRCTWSGLLGFVAEEMRCHGDGGVRTILLLHLIVLGEQRRMPLFKTLTKTEFDQAYQEESLQIVLGGRAKLEDVISPDTGGRV